MVRTKENKAHVFEYILHPGEVWLAFDGLMHHIDAETLAKLYEVPFERCKIFGKAGVHHIVGHVHLWPLSKGDYVATRKALEEELRGTKILFRLNKERLAAELKKGAEP